MCLWSEQDNHNVALRKKVHEKSPWQLLDDGTIDRSAFPVLNLCFCVRFVGSWQTSLAESSPSLPAAARSFPSLTGHLHEAGQPPVGVVHQQDAVLAQPHASQKQHHHLFKQVLLYAACGGARPPRHLVTEGTRARPSQLLQTPAAHRAMTAARGPHSPLRPSPHLWGRWPAAWQRGRGPSPRGHSR